MKGRLTVLDYDDYDKVNAGGLMRCCLETLDEHYPNGPACIAAEGEVLPCKYCSSSMVFHLGWWNWQRTKDHFAARLDKRWRKPHKSGSPVTDNIW